MYDDKRITERGDLTEAYFCKRWNLTSDQYLELWYETGCEFAENLFKPSILSEIAKRNGVHLLISSKMYWYHWVHEWLNTCEAYMDWNYTAKGMDDFKKMQLQARRPWKLIQDLILDKEGV